MDAPLGLHLIVAPTLKWLATLGIASDARAEVMLLAMAGQESGWKHRRQMGSGPARGLWQFERIAVREVLTHRATRGVATAVCSALLVPAAEAEVHATLEHNDALACTFARLLLWRDPRPLPTSSAEGWAYYLRNWAPGQPRPETWQANWLAARHALEVA